MLFFDNKPIFMRTCGRCHQRSWWVTRKESPFTLNLVPIITYYYVVCPLCKERHKLTPGLWSNSGEVQQARDLATLTDDYYQRHSISAEVYQAACESNPIWQKYADKVSLTASTQVFAARIQSVVQLGVLDSDRLGGDRFH